MLTAEQLVAAFDAPEPLTVGLEEEVLLLDPETLDLAPCGPEVLDRMNGDPRAKLELPAAQVELLTRPHDSVPDAIAELTGAREALAGAAAGLALPAALSVHPFAAPEGQLNPGARYEAIEEEYGWAVRRQLVGSLQVHVAVGGAARTLAVYNALRGHLPEVAALAAGAPYYEGVDTGLASVRPAICTLLPRQGLPPRIDSWEDFAQALAWGAAAGSVPEPRRWWYELRPHVAYGTLELRVPDTQPDLAGAAAVAAFAHALVAWLGARHDAGEALPSHPAWRIGENRWSAARHGVEGAFADLETGESRPTRTILAERLAELAPHAERLGCAGELAGAQRLVERNAAIEMRAAGERDGARSVAAWATEWFLRPRSG